MDPPLDPPEYEELPMEDPPVADSGLTLTQAAAQLGITERTLRAHIKEGKVAARKVIGSKGVAVYRVYLQDLPVDQPEDPLSEHPVDLSDPSAEAFIRHIAHLEQTIMELSGRVGFLQAELLQLQEQVKLLSAPAESLTSHSAITYMPASDGPGEQAAIALT